MIVVKWNLRWINACPGTAADVKRHAVGQAATGHGARVPRLRGWKLPPRLFYNQSTRVARTRMTNAAVAGRLGGNA